VKEVWKRPAVFGESPMAFYIYALEARAVFVGPLWILKE